MKIIRKQVYVQTPKTIESYMSSDGFEFASRRDCEIHEEALGFKGIKVVETAIDVMGDFFTEQPTMLYKVENEEDWNILVERVWFYRQSEPTYPGPGLYFAIKEYCGDYPEEYTICEYDEYMSKLHHYYNEFCDRMEDAYLKFNT